MCLLRSRQKEQLLSHFSYVRPNQLITYLMSNKLSPLPLPSVQLSPVPGYWMIQQQSICASLLIFLYLISMQSFFCHKDGPFLQQEYSLSKKILFEGLLISTDTRIRCSESWEAVIPHQLQCLNLCELWSIFVSAEVHFLPFHFFLCDLA